MKKLFNLLAGLVLSGGLVANAAAPSLQPIKTLQAERTDEIRALTEGTAMLNSGGKAIEKPVKAERASRLTEMSQLPAATEKEKADQAVMLKALSMKKSPSRAGAVKTGTMISADFSINGRPYVSIMTLEADGDTYIMKNIYGLASTEQGSDASVKVTVNAQAGTVSIKPGKIYTHEKYGQVWMVSYDPEANTISSRKEITGYINEKGEIQLGPWAVAVPTGEYRGRMFNAFTQSYWGPQNATVKTELINSKDGFKQAEYPALFRQLNANQVMTLNLANQEDAYLGTLTAQKTVRITPQYTFNDVSYGEFDCFFCEWDGDKGKVYGDRNIIATQDANGKLKIPGWVISCKASVSMLAQGMRNTEITLTSPLAYPADMGTNFEGEGTKASPYLITTPQDLVKLSAAVNGGISYAGKYFALKNELDMSTLNMVLEPIGDVQNSFDGIFDGRGLAIKNLRISSLGAMYGGLFGRTGQGSEIRDIRLENPQVQGTGRFIGIVAGRADGKISYINISNGVVAGSGNLTGGIAGAAYGTVAECQVSAKIQGANNIGGIAGWGCADITNCHVQGSLELMGYDASFHNVGGIAGTFSVEDKKDRWTISGCSFDGEITDNVGGGSLGGLVGILYRNVLKQSFAVASIAAHNAFTDPTKDTATGGLCAYISAAEVTDCYASGNLVKPEKSNCAGGLFGTVAVTYSSSSSEGNRMTDLSQVTNCYSSVQMITLSTEDHKGIYGYCGSMFNFDPVAETFGKGVYFDQKINDFRNEKWGVETGYLTSGQLPENFSGSVWQTESGLYPVLKVSASTQASKLASSVFVIADKQWSGKVKSAAELKAPEGISLYLFGGEGLCQSTENAQISGNKVEFKDAYSSEMVVAVGLEGKDMKFVQMKAVPNWFEGEGTAESPYLIKSASDFEKLHTAVGVYKQSHRDDYFKMADDIDFTGSKFEGIGAKRSDCPFNGVFDGNGKTIHNLNLKAGSLTAEGKLDTNTSWQYSGLFNEIGSFGTLKNLIVGTDCRFDLPLYGGGMAYLNSGRIEGCAFLGEISAIRGMTGGIAAVNAPDAIITDCYFGGSLKIGESHGGGIVAQNNGTVQYCQNDGHISGEKVSENTDKTNYNTIGGIAAISYGKIKGCINQGTISGYETIGGITGEYSNTYGIPEISDCLSTGMIECDNLNTQERGAIAGVGSSSVTLSGNYYDASVIRTGAVAGAIRSGISQLSTAELISAKPAQGLGGDKLLFAEKRYPVLKAFADYEPSKAMSSIYVSLEKGQFISDIRKDTPLSTAQDLKWALAGQEGSVYSLEGNTLKMKALEGENLSKDVLTGTVGGKYTKVFSLRSVPALFAGEGTMASPYQIATTDDMTKLANFMEKNAMDYEGYYFKLLNDLDYTGKTFEPIARKSVQFQADFDGNGKTIRNYNVDLTESAKEGEGGKMGLWGKVGNFGRIHDLKLDGTFFGFTYCGGLVGELFGTISNCEMRGKVLSKSDHVGGFAYHVNNGALIENCRNYAHVECTGRYGAGGIAAMVAEEGTIDGCVNYGELQAAERYAAGIVYRCFGTLKNCVNEGTYVVNGPLGGRDYCGIAVRLLGKARVIKCVNKADITINTPTATSDSKVGGIFGEMQAATSGSMPYDIEVRDCENYGNITLSIKPGVNNSSYNPIGCAGIGVRVAGNVTIEGCRNYGNITATGSAMAGGCFVSFDSSNPDSPDRPHLITVRNSHNYGDVYSEKPDLGGFAASTGDNNELIDCSNHGEVTCMGSGICVGGFSGDGYANMTRCYNVGEVSSSAGATGGFVGLIARGTYKECFNTGNVSTTAFNQNGTCGGFTGDLREAAVLQDCYTMGNVTAPGWISGFAGKAPQGTPKMTRCYSASRVNCLGYDVDGKKQFIMGNFLLDTFEQFKTNMTDCWYDATLMPEKSSQENATAKTTRELQEMTPGEVWTNVKAFYPMLTSMMNINARHAAAHILYNDSDDANNVRENITLASDPGLTWTASEHFTISGDQASSVKLGKGWLKCTADGGKLEKTIEVTVTALSSIDDIIEDGREVSERVIYDLSGRQVINPIAGTVYVVRTIFKDGGSKTEKKVYIED